MARHPFPPTLRPTRILVIHDLAGDTTRKLRALTPRDLMAVAGGLADADFASPAASEPAVPVIEPVDADAGD